MPKSRPMRRNPIFVFGPPVAFITLGLSLIFQPNSFGANQHEIVLDRIKARAESGWVVPSLSITDFSYPRFATEQAGHEWVLVNKSRPLQPIDFAPEDLRVIKSSESLDNSRELRLRSSAATALEQLASDMFQQGAGQLFINSSYRSFEYQAELYQQNVAELGEEQAALIAAKAGYSEHQTGLAADVSAPDQGCAVMTCFGDTIAGKWLAENSWKYGFIIRYEAGTSDITGYSYEPWHIRFIGKPLAKMYYENGMNTLEEMWQLPAAPSYPQEITASTID